MLKKSWNLGHSFHRPQGGEFVIRFEKKKHVILKNTRYMLPQCMYVLQVQTGAISYYLHSPDLLR